MISKNEMITQLRGRRRSVEAEIKRVQEEPTIDDIRAATNMGYLTALDVELSFLTNLLAQSEKHKPGDWLDGLLDDVRKEQQQKP